MHDLCVRMYLPDDAAPCQLLTKHFKGLSEAKAEVAQVRAEMGRPGTQLSAEKDAADARSNALIPPQ